MLLIYYCWNMLVTIVATVLIIFSINSMKRLVARANARSMIENSHTKYRMNSAITLVHLVLICI